jgi:glycosyltransferase involved in cell wall biosynthesis
MVLKVVMTLLVRDEVDIIESNIDFHLKMGVDFIIATDNGSVDGTTEILRKYECAGKLEYIYEPPSDFSQWAWVTRMARRAYCNHGADWVINGDADEFFVPATEHSMFTIKDHLAHVSKHVDMIEVDRHDFVPIESNFQCGPVEEMIYRKRCSQNLRADPLPPKVIHRGVEDIAVSQGNHSARSEFLNNSPEPCCGISVYHYPIRSPSQFERKVKNAGSGYAKNTCLSSDIGFHKRYWYDLFLNGNLGKEFRKHFFDAERLSRALSSGEVVEDRMLSDHVKKINHGREITVPK